MIWRGTRTPRTDDNDPELLFRRVREVETQLRDALKIFRDHLDELEAEIDLRQEEV